ncbi:MAG: flavin reductase [Lachnospiraceae bacterium]|nr:flavin reductase [Lachnospiraceae bacterium]
MSSSSERILYNSFKEISHFVLYYLYTNSIECSVIESTIPGTHELFIGKVEAVHVDEEYLDAKGNILWDKMDLM